MVSKKKQEEQEKIEEESKELVQNMKQGLGSFSKLLEDEKPGKTKAEQLKDKL